MTFNKGDVLVLISKDESYRYTVIHDNGDSLMTMFRNNPKSEILLNKEKVLERMGTGWKLISLPQLNLPEELFTL